MGAPTGLSLLAAPAAAAFDSRGVAHFCDASCPHFFDGHLAADRVGRHRDRGGDLAALAALAAVGRATVRREAPVGAAPLPADCSRDSRRCSAALATLRLGDAPLPADCSAIPPIAPAIGAAPLPADALRHWRRSAFRRLLPQFYLHTPARPRRSAQESDALCHLIPGNGPEGCQSGTWHLSDCFY